MAKMINATTKGSIVAKISDNVNKHGKIKCKNKKVQKEMTDACFHHIINKRGKVKPRIHNNGAGMCTCSMCVRSFNTKLKSKGEMKKIVEPFVEALDQAKFITISAGLGKETEDYLANLSIGVGKFAKIYTKVTHIAKKTENVKKSKKKSGNKNGYEPQMGSWKGSWK